VGIRKRKKQ